ncbi:hypothetical protein GALMADRAFT_1121728 [Galerina marginata CBS 339.88]|uniref:Uncharacterized protein n=1 Tax=Galerina marginata (strain CBS 339.88) TaxID=685588 RepID=A0A067TCY4_GALM3|nr:hypothetical protein GALMADRAFT_1121728 [Galerina marginata CBS 339.88]
MFRDSWPVFVLSNNEEPVKFVLFRTDEGLKLRKHHFSEEKMWCTRSWQLRRTDPRQETMLLVNSLRLRILAVLMTNPLTNSSTVTSIGYDCPSRCTRVYWYASYCCYTCK